MMRQINERYVENTKIIWPVNFSRLPPWSSSSLHYHHNHHHPPSPATNQQFYNHTITVTRVLKICSEVKLEFLENKLSKFSRLIPNVIALVLNELFVVIFVSPFFSQNSIHLLVSLVSNYPSSSSWRNTSISKKVVDRIRLSPKDIFSFILCFLSLYPQKIISYSEF